MRLWLGQYTLVRSPNAFLYFDTPLLHMHGIKVKEIVKILNAKSLVRSPNAISPMHSARTTHTRSQASAMYRRVLTTELGDSQREVHGKLD